MDFVVPADHRVKSKECEKRDKYLDLTWESKKLWNMKLTIIPIVIGALGTVTKGLVQELEGLEIRGDWRPSKLLHYWERPEYWEEFCRLQETCCHSNSSERLSAKTGVKNSIGVKKNNNNNKFWIWTYQTYLNLRIIFLQTRLMGIEFYTRYERYKRTSIWKHNTQM